MRAGSWRPARGGQSRARCRQGAREQRGAGWAACQSAGRCKSRERGECPGSRVGSDWLLGSNRNECPPEMPALRETWMSDLWLRRAAGVRTEGEVVAPGGLSAAPGNELGSGRELTTARPPVHFSSDTARPICANHGSTEWGTAVQLQIRHVSDCPNQRLTVGHHTTNTEVAGRENRMRRLTGRQRLCGKSIAVVCASLGRRGNSPPKIAWSPTNAIF
jgi:hypothetical protein